MGQEATAFDFIERCDDHKTVDDLLDDLSHCAAAFGFSHLIYTGLPVGSQSIAPLVRMNKFPKPWWQRYTSRGYDRIDGVCRHALQTTEPFFWHEIADDYADEPLAARVAAEAAEHGLADGYLVPLYSPDLWQSALSFGCETRCDLSPREQGAMNLIAMYASNAIRRRLFEDRPKARLTEREREILRWLAAGKSQWDISVILSISENTVRNHSAQLREKLNAVNTTQAVVEALRLREIAL